MKNKSVEYLIQEYRDAVETVKKFDSLHDGVDDLTYFMWQKRAAAAKIKIKDLSALFYRDVFLRYLSAIIITGDNSENIGKKAADLTQSEYWDIYSAISELSDEFYGAFFNKNNSEIVSSRIFGTLMNRLYTLCNENNVAQYNQPPLTSDLIYALNSKDDLYKFIYTIIVDKVGPEILLAIALNGLSEKFSNNITENKIFPAILRVKEEHVARLLDSLRSLNSEFTPVVLATNKNIENADFYLLSEEEKDILKVFKSIKSKIIKK